MRALALILAALVTGSADARPLHRGGYIDTELRRIVAAGGERHVIAGDCMSSCTMWLGARGACVTPDAVLYFHAAARGDNPWNIDATGNAVMLGMYPPKVRAVVRGWLNSPDFQTLTGRELAGLGVPLCRE